MGKVQDALKLHEDFLYPEVDAIQSAIAEANVNFDQLSEAAGLPQEIQLDAEEFCATLGLTALRLRDDKDTQQVAASIPPEMERFDNQFMDDEEVIILHSDVPPSQMVEQLQHELSEAQEVTRPRRIGVFGPSGYGKDEFVTTARRDIENAYEITMGGFFRALTKSVLYRAAKDRGLDLDDPDQVNMFLNNDELVREIIAEITGHDSGIIIVPTLDTENPNAAARKRINAHINGIDDTDEIAIKAAERVEKSVAFIAKHSQIESIYFAQRALEYLEGEVPADSIIFVQGRGYTLDCITRFDHLVRIDHPEPLQVGARRFGDIVKKHAQKRGASLNGTGEGITQEDILAAVRELASSIDNYRSPKANEPSSSGQNGSNGSNPEKPQTPNGVSTYEGSVIFGSDAIVPDSLYLLAAETSLSKLVAALGKNAYSIVRPGEMALVGDAYPLLNETDSVYGVAIRLALRLVDLEQQVHLLNRNIPFAEATARGATINYTLYPPLAIRMTGTEIEDDNTVVAIAREIHARTETEVADIITISGPSDAERQLLIRRLQEVSGKTIIEIPLEQLNFGLAALVLAQAAAQRAPAVKPVPAVMMAVGAGYMTAALPALITESPQYTVFELERLFVLYGDQKIPQFRVQGNHVNLVFAPQGKLTKEDN